MKCFAPKHFINPHSIDDVINYESCQSEDLTHENKICFTVKRVKQINNDFVARLVMKYYVNEARESLLMLYCYNLELYVSAEMYITIYYFIIRIGLPSCMVALLGHYEF